MENEINWQNKEYHLPDNPTYENDHGCEMTEAKAKILLYLDFSIWFLDPG